ncbi:MAG: extracellular solute-binding protein [Alphaproteobacteria bacterium]|nr:extracellular solute-binding protein [Alphaproteobacteria bacterium]
MNKLIKFATVTTIAGCMASSALAVEIDYWQYTFKGRVDAIDALIEQFEANNPDITVNHNHFPYADYRTKVAAAIPAGEGPDVVQLFYGWLEDYVGAELIRPLPADRFDPANIDEAYFPIVQAMKRDGAYMALPTAVRSLALFYNKRLLEKAGVGVPTTLDELVEATKAIAERDGSGNLLVAGMTFGMTAQDHHWWREVLTRQFGGQPYSDDNTKVTYTDAGGVEALAWYVDMIETHEVGAVGFMDEPQAAFKASRAGFHIDGSFRLGALREQRGLDWGVTELPTHNGVKSNFSSYWVNGITSKAEGEKLEAAYKFLEFLTSDEAMQLWVETVGELPAKPSAALTEANLNHEEYGPFIRGLEYAQTTVFAEESAQRQGMVDALDRILLEGMSVEDSLAAAAAAEQELLDKFHQ